jgi:predicted DNA-binding protein (MmcQ/YjbR family)
MARRKTTLAKTDEILRTIALDYPEATLDHPWGHDAFKVRKKVFLFLALEDGRLGLSLKIPGSAKQALKNTWAEPTGYGLGKHGWVSASFGKSDDPPLGLLQQWLDESYRNVAPKKLVKLLGLEE